MKKYFFVLFILISNFHTLHAKSEMSDEIATHTKKREKTTSFKISCIQTNANGDVTISWTSFIDPSGTFVEYKIYSLQNGLIATIPSIGTTSYIIPTVNQKNDFYITVTSGIGGTIQTYSDTLANIFLSVNNPSDGTAVLQWNDPISPALSSMDNYYKIYREYPVGNWVIRDSVPFGTHFYKDTIDICQAFLNYQIILENQPCNFTSNIAGDDFVDKISPSIPIIEEITIDTLTNELTINWNQNNQPDTYGYIIYSIDGNGFSSEIDTVWGLSNTSYTYNPEVNSGALTYSIAAFDSCFTTSVIPTYQTSAKAELHTTMFLRNSLIICANTVNLSWNAYVGWDNLSSYEIWGHIIGQPWTNYGSTSALNYSITGEGLQDYCFAIKAISEDGKESFSNRSCLTIVAPSQPDFNYLKVATVTGNKIELRHLIDLTGGVKEISFERLNKKGIFEEIYRAVVTSPTITFVDSLVLVDQLSYTYRAVVIDSCDNPGSISNSATTILLTVKTNDIEKTHYLNWSQYQDFNGSILGYNIFRGNDGIYGQYPIAILSKSQYFYEDRLDTNYNSSKTCYYIEAIEGLNIFGLNEKSRSNEVCSIIKPIIYIPNSFTPNGDSFNQIFAPDVSYFDYSSYELIIYDRWEHPIFNSNLAEDGWTGEINSTGKMAEPGSYVYLLKLKDGEGIEIVKRGHVNLLR